MICCRLSHTGPHECHSLLQDLITQIESKEKMLRQDEALYDADTVLDLQQSIHTIQVLSVWKTIVKHSNNNNNNNNNNNTIIIIISQQPRPENW